MKEMYPYIVFVYAKNNVQGMAGGVKLSIRNEMACNFVKELVRMYVSS